MKLEFSKNELYFKAVEICKAIESHGGKSYFVGGCVRDACLKIETLDFDIEVFGLQPDVLQSILTPDYPLSLIGKSFSVLKVKTFDIDISIPRRDSKKGLGHRGFEIASDPFMSIEDSLLRRDFTINAMLYDPIQECLIDPFGGYQDLNQRTLRHVSDFFADDPLRVLRAMQFIARFDLEIAPETLAICQKIEPEGLSKERIFFEWKKLILKGIQISKGLEFLVQSGWIQYFPELSAIQGCPQEKKWHPEGDVWKHTKLCMDAFVKSRHQKNDQYNLTVGFAVLLHDVGKAATTLIKEQKIKSPMHDIVGEKLAGIFLAQITNQKTLIQQITNLVRLHMLPYQLYDQNSSQAAIKRLVLKVHDIQQLLSVAKADHNGRGGEYNESFDALDWINQQLDIMNLQNSKPQPIILGRHLIEIGLKPSQKFKAILTKCLDAQLEGVFNNVEEGKEYAKKLSFLRT